MGKEYRPNLVSVVVCTFNHVDFIDETLTSIINQTYRDLEILVCDDCSTDGTTDKIKEWAIKDYRVIPLLSSKNEGFSNNINKGFNAASGEFFSLIGGDDKMAPEKIQKQVEFLKENRSFDVVLHWVDVFDSKNGNIKYTINQNILNSPTDWFFSPRNFWFSYKKRNSTFPPTAYLARSEYALHGRYDVRLKYKNEILYAIDNYMNKPFAKWYCIPEILGYYRIHSNNMHTSSQMNKSLMEETYINYAIASAKYPNISRDLKNGLIRFLFNDLYFAYLQSKDSEKELIKDCKRRLYSEAGIYRYTILILIIKIKLFKNKIRK